MTSVRKRREGVGGLTPVQAQALHAAALARGSSPLWFVCADQAGRVLARGYIETRAGGELIGVIEAGTLDELRAMLPIGLTRRERAPVHADDVIETWD